MNDSLKYDCETQLTSNDDTTTATNSIVAIPIEQPQQQLEDDCRGAVVDVIMTATTTDEIFQQPPLPKFQINQRVNCLYNNNKETDSTTTGSTNANTSSSNSSQWYDAIVRKVKLEHTTTSIATATTSETNETVTSPQQQQQQQQQQQSILTWFYLIHYQGWNSRYDRWCTEDMIRYRKEEELPTTTTDTNDSSTSSDPFANSLPVGMSQQPLFAVESEHGRHDTATTLLRHPISPKKNAKKHSRTTTTTSAAMAIESRRKKLRLSSNNQNESNEITMIKDHDSVVVVPTVCTYTDYCQLPITLQIVLMEEQERIVNQQLLHQLPAPVPIRKVLHHYIKRKLKEVRKNITTTNNNVKVVDLKEGPNKVTITKESKTKCDTNGLLTEDVIRTFGQSFQELLEQALSKCLLYPHERLQYIHTVQPMLQQQQQQQQQENAANDCNDDEIATSTTGTPMKKATTTTTKLQMELIDIYGCEYLLRLYVRLPMLLEGMMLYTATTTSTDIATSLSSPHVLGPLLGDLLVVLQKNRSTLFPLNNNYVPR